MGQPDAMLWADDALLARAMTGDGEALAALLRHYGPQVRRELKIGAPWRSVLDAEDVMQATYIEACLRIDRFTSQGPGSFLAWLRRIAQNNLRDAIKSLTREKRPPPEKRIEPPRGADSFVALCELVDATDSTPSRNMANQEAKAILDAAIGELPPTYATVVRLCDLEGRSVQEVAKALGRSPAAVYMLRLRAHDRLRELLGSQSRFLGDQA